MMKELFMILALMIGGNGDSQKLPKELTRSERKFVKNVIELTNDVLVDVTKRKDGVIVVEFWNTICTLTPEGFIDKIWILEDEDWVLLAEEY